MPQVYDVQRDMIINKLGLKILRIKNEEVRYNLAGVLKKIRNYL